MDARPGAANVARVSRRCTGYGGTLHWNRTVSLSMLFKQLGMDASCRGLQEITTKPVEENDLGRADMGKRLTHFGVATVLLAGISLCVAQGYKGFVALQTPPAPVVSDVMPTPALPSQPALLREPMSAGAG